MCYPHEAQTRTAYRVAAAVGLLLIGAAVWFVGWAPTPKHGAVPTHATSEGIMRPILKKDVRRVGSYQVWTFQGEEGQKHEALVPCDAPRERNNNIWVLDYLSSEGGHVFVAACPP